MFIRVKIEVEGGEEDMPTYKASEARLNVNHIAGYHPYLGEPYHSMIYMTEGSVLKAFISVENLDLLINQAVIYPLSN